MVKRILSDSDEAGAPFFPEHAAKTSVVALSFPGKKVVAALEVPVLEDEQTSKLA